MAAMQYVVFFALCLIITKVECTCTIPGGLQGTWSVEGRQETLTLTPSMLIGVELTQFPSIVFNCFQQNGNKYVFKSNIEQLFKVSVTIYFCLEFNQITANSYQMYELTHKIGLYYEDRARAFLLSDDPAVTVNDVCQLDKVQAPAKIITRQ